MSKERYVICKITLDDKSQVTMIELHIFANRVTNRGQFVILTTDYLSLVMQGLPSRLVLQMEDHEDFCFLRQDPQTSPSVNIM